MPTASLDTRRRLVELFHTRFGHPIRTVPTVPPEDEVRFRMALMTEEFTELFRAAIDVDAAPPHLRLALETIRAAVDGKYPYQRAPVKVDLPEFIDACEDLGYVIEGTELVFGVDGQPALIEIQRANMSKEPNGPDGKPVKPEGWTPPDIAGVLRAQGWEE